MVLHEYFTGWIMTMIGHEKEYRQGEYTLHFYAPNGNGFMYTLDRNGQTLLRETMRSVVGLGEHPIAMGS